MSCHESTYKRNSDDPEPLESHSPPHDKSEKLNPHSENASKMSDKIMDSCTPEVANEGLVDDGGRR